MLDNRIVALLLILAAFLPACNQKVKEVSATEFCKIYELPVGTMVFSKFVGVDKGYAYIELHKMSSINSRSWDIEKYRAHAREVMDVCQLPK